MDQGFDLLQSLITNIIDVSVLSFLPVWKIDMIEPAGRVHVSIVECSERISDGLQATE